MRNFDTPSSPYLSVFPTEHLFWSAYFPMHFCHHQSSLLQCNLQFSNNVVHSILKSHKNAFLCIFPNTQNNFLPKFPVYIFWLTAFTIVCDGFESIFSTHFRPHVKQTPFDPILKRKSVFDNGTRKKTFLPILLAVILENKPHHPETLEY